MLKITLMVALVIVQNVSFAQSSDKPIQLFSLGQVLLSDGPFLSAQQTDLKYMMSMDPDRLLAPYLEDAGFDPVQPHYDNWEGSGLNGHIGGHYLSALAMMYAATGDAELKIRLDYMIDWLARCQEKNGGYVGGIPDGKRIWNEISKGEIRADYFSLNGGWVPLYNIHKLFAGLRDAYLFGENQKAFEVWTTLSDWWVSMLSNLSDQQIQQMLKSEHGGMSEVFADLYEITQTPEYLQTAEQLSHRLLLNTLSNHTDSLTGMHANTQIPKVIGYEKVSKVSDHPEWEDAAVFFWETVVDNRTISIGGNSVREHFHNADDFTTMVTSEQGPETCNTYNMLRLSKMLFMSTQNPKYMDYYERAQYNHILSSQHPDGGFVYFTPVRPRHYRVYSQSDQGMWCCVGSGLENHTKYGELIYAHQGDDLLVNLFIPSTLSWDENGIRLTQSTKFPESPATALKLHLKKSSKFALKVRIPDWLSSYSLNITVNGSSVNTVIDNGYEVVLRKWKDGDEVLVHLPMEMKFELLPDRSKWGSFVYGPMVLAATTDTTHLEGLYADDSRMGHVASGPFYPTSEAPILIGTSKDVVASLVQSDPNELKFELRSHVYSEEHKGLVLQPFYQIHDARYMLYWPIMNSKELKINLVRMQQEEEERFALKAITVDDVSAGEQQPESEHGFKGENTSMGYSNECYWRAGRGWFSYQMSNPKEEARFLRVTYEVVDVHEFEILINGERLVEEKLQVTSEGTVTQIYDLPSAFGLESEVRFEAVNTSSIPHVLDVRLIRE